MDIETPTRLPNGHDSHAGIAAENCPLCDQPIVDRAKMMAVLGRQQAHDAEIVRTAEARLQTAQKSAITRAVKEAVRVAEVKMKELRDHQAGIVAAAVDAERQKAGQAVSDAVTAAKVEFAGEKARLEQQLHDVTRRLQAKTAFQIGEKPEADLAESMAQLCAGDRVTRTARGVRGGDVLIEVLYGDNQEVAGKILLDSKAHAKWQSSFSRKLAIDKAAVEADFALLVSTVLPSGEQQICIRDGVICCTPERASVLVSMLRKIILDNFVLKLSTQQRDTKADRLFNFLVSGAGGDLFDRLIRLTRDLEALGLAEERSHKLTWSKRAELIRGVVEVHETFTTTIADVVGGGR